MLRKIQTLSLVFALGLFCVSCTAQEPDAGQPAAQPVAGGDSQVKDPKSYLIGFSFGSQLKNDLFQANDFEADSLVKGIMDALASQEPKLSREQQQAASQAIQTMIQQRMATQQAEMQAAGGANLQKSQAFLQANAQKEGVETLPSGLQYKVLKEGTGESPTANSRVTVHYTGKLIDGTVFDSSVQRGQPAQFGVSQVIPGWTEALQKMKVGGKWMLYIPPNLAYGQNAPESIGPNQALIFEVELLGIDG